MPVALLAQSSSPLTPRHHHGLCAYLNRNLTPDNVPEVQLVAESYLRIVCVDSKAAQTLISVIYAHLKGDRADVCVTIETFGVSVCGSDGWKESPEVLLLEMIRNNRLTMAPPDIHNVHLGSDNVWIVEFLSLSVADSAILRGIGFNGAHYTCKPVDKEDRGVFWCYRCNSIFCVSNGGPCGRKDACCRYCEATSHISSACPGKHDVDLQPSCKDCRVAKGNHSSDHIAWDAVKCCNSWHRRHPHKNFELQRKRKASLEAAPDGLPRGKVQCVNTAKSSKRLQRASVSVAPSSGTDTTSESAPGHVSTQACTQYTALTPPPSVDIRNMDHAVSTPSENDRPAASFSAPTTSGCASQNESNFQSTLFASDEMAANNREWDSSSLDWVAFIRGLTPCPELATFEASFAQPESGLSHFLDSSPAPAEHKADPLDFDWAAFDPGLTPCPELATFEASSSQPESGLSHFLDSSEPSPVLAEHKADPLESDWAAFIRGLTPCPELAAFEASSSQLGSGLSPVFGSTESHSITADYEIELPGIDWATMPGEGTIHNAPADLEPVSAFDKDIPWFLPTPRYDPAQVT